VSIGNAVVETVEIEKGGIHRSNRCDDDGNLNIAVPKGVTTDIPIVGEGDSLEYVETRDSDVAGLMAQVISELRGIKKAINYMADIKGDFNG